MEYEVIRSGRRSIAAEIRDGRLLVRAPLRTSDGQIERFVQQHRRWIETHLAQAAQDAAAPKLTEAQRSALAERARQTIPERVAHYAARIGVRYGKITIRCQKTRWGSCSSRGDLSFNCLLLLAPPEVLDSVVVHELCHRKQMNHSARFYDEVLRVFPEYPACRSWLNRNGKRLLAMR